MAPPSHQQNFGNCQLGDVRLNRRAAKIGQVLSQKFGQALSMVFDQAQDLKRAYEFFQIPRPSSRNSLHRTAP
ncbi:MAG: transposase DNA-binding-containing protein [Cyanobacteria bacterium J06597_1]